MASWLRASAFGVGILLAAGAAAQPSEDAPEAPPPEAGRYQAIRMNDNIVLVIDTATGDCWSRGLSPSTDWRYEGSPVRTIRPTGRVIRPERGEPRPPFLNLRNGDTAEVTVRQRGRSAVPTSNDTLFVQIGDITEGQTIVSLRDEIGQPIIRDRSLRQGESLRFDVDDRPYDLQVVELRNLLTGTDFAVLRVQPARADEAEGEPLDEPRAADAAEDLSDDIRDEAPVPAEPRP